MSDKGRQLLIEFGSNIRKLRLSKKLSYRQMSLLCDIDASNLKRIEKGNVNATILTLHELARALEVNVDVLLKYKPE
ncbi:helix-turn-helix transcriptional regulator [Mucilaginibacter rubeus]|uniref:Helix-turn-helix transcriptional regulator n=1 Tax=Mucilaginibacter rubeus TaxID=2027860 RepID=A0AAE6JM04_9SPHI|nr:helix-turn-helix transcriptional regulator [Mucilaginibacter rubeus]QEM20642.1 helix-turn-helix transcriptional regulator [Mucilaginibacter gossypii]